MAGFTKEMMEALEADGELLSLLTGEDHRPVFLADCPACEGLGYTVHRVTVYEHGCGFPHDDTDERRCSDCDGTGLALSEGPRS